MNKLLFITLIFISGALNAQTNYEKGMQKALDAWEADKVDEAENIYERIANAELDQWLPHYYIALINSTKSWQTKDEATLKRQLDKAQQHLDLAMVISKDNPELLILQAYVYTNWVAFDGMTYGRKYSGKITELYKKAHDIAPTNPRVVFGKAEWDMGSARYFGKDTTPYCDDIEKAIGLFTNFKPESKFHPNWGKERAEQVLKSCKEQ